MDCRSLKARLKKFTVEGILSEYSHLQYSARTTVERKAGKSLVPTVDRLIVDDVFAVFLSQGVLSEFGKVFGCLAVAIRHGKDQYATGLQQAV